MKIKNKSGFALLEVLLAITLIAIASFGAYSLFSSSKNSQYSDQVVNEAIALSSVFSQLYVSQLTQNIASSSDLVSLFYNSKKLSDGYFTSNGSTISNNYGNLLFNSINSQGFTMTIPVGTSNTDYQAEFCKRLASYTTICTTQGGGQTITATVNVVGGN